MKEKSKRNSKTGSLSLQISVIMIAVVTITMAVFGYRRIINQTEMLENNLRVSVGNTKNWLEAALGMPIYNYDTVTVDSLCYALLSNRDIAQIKVEANGEWKKYGNRISENEDYATDNYITMQAPISYRGTNVGSVELVASTRNLKEQIGKLTRITVIQILSVDLILVTTLLILLMYKFIRPVKKLQIASKRITEGDLDRDIVVNTRNEISLLAENLNKMKNSLKDKIGALEKENRIRLQRESELYRAKKYIDNIINSMPSMLIAVDDQCRVTQWNKRMESVTGILFSEAEGKKFYEVVPSLSSFGEIVETAVSGREIQFSEYQRMDIGAKQGFVNVLVYPLMVKGDTGAVIIIEDVTDQYRMREELSHIRKLDAIGQLAGGVAHDFNNMLGGILGGAELLSRRIDPESREREYLEMIIQSATRAADVTGKLLAFSRKGKVESTSISVNKVIEDTVTLLEHSINKKISIECRFNTESDIIIGDPAQIQSAFMNIGINAGHSMPDGGHIYISVDNIRLDPFFCNTSPFDIMPGDYLKIEIRDTGSGISRENIEHIFEPFFTTKGPGKGTGLGLSAAYGTVVDHHGAITVYSEIGIGTSFHIYLPLSEKPKTDSSSGYSPPVPGTGLILVVDDEEILRITAGDILKELGYSVVLAGNGKEGIDRFREVEGKVDLVILDMIMPEMDGRECFYRLKEINPDVRVIIASGFTRDDEVKKLLDDGLCGFIRKPYTIGTLSSMLSGILDMEDCGDK